MATSIGTYYGTQVGPNDVRFRAVSQLRYTDVDLAKGYWVQRRYYAEVVKNPGSTFTNHAKTSWGINDFSMNSAGTYADTGWQDVGWVAYGSSVSANGYVYYNSNSGTQYKSSVAGSYTVPKPTYTVSYNANGGSGAPSAQTKTYGKNLTLSIDKPTRKGYNFKGWATTASGSVKYAAGGTYSDNASVTLYAVWEAITITVTFHRNTSDGDTTVKKSIFSYGVSGQSFQDTGWSRSGYAALGWSQDKHADNRTYSLLSSVADSWILQFAPAVDLYMVWERKTNGYIRQNGVYKSCLIYQKKNAAYKSGAVYAKNGTYKNT